MIISCNEKPELYEFISVLDRATALLNADATIRTEYYLRRDSRDLEKDVERELITAAKGTVFEGSIEIVSGRHFPDIVAKRYYGVEVKSTKKNKWTSIGSSVMESSRVEEVERIFLTFGKLAKPVEFRSRPYEECLSGASVTHSPRYDIDMNLKKGESIFELMNTTYDEIRENNPEFAIINYYKSQLKDGERFWWSGSDDVESTGFNEMKVRLATAVSKEERDELTAWGLSLFPEVLKPRGDYAQFVLWMASEYHVVSPSVRDFFTSGGRHKIEADKYCFERMPGDFIRIKRLKNRIVQNIKDSEESILRKTWKVDVVQKDRIGQWIDCVCKLRNLEEYDTRLVLNAIFNRK